MTVGERIKKRRESLNLSQGDLASIMNVSRQAISKAELHDDNITTDKVYKFAKALDCSISYLMGYEDDERLMEIEMLPTKDEKEQYKLLMTYYAQLTPEQQESILNLIKNMV